MPLKEKICAVLYVSFIIISLYLIATERRNMAEISIALPIILKHEGGYSNVKGDSGGETYKGISRNNFPKWEGWEIIDQYKQVEGSLTDEQLISNELLDRKIHKFYNDNFWDVMNLDLVKSQEVATKIMDMAVNMGVYRAAVLVQQVLANKCREQLDIDGKIGPETLRCINKQQTGYMLNLLRERSKQFYLGLVESKPHLNKFLQGWLKRAAQ